MGVLSNPEMSLKGGTGGGSGPPSGSCVIGQGCGLSRTVGEHCPSERSVPGSSESRRTPSTLGILRSGWPDLLRPQPLGTAHTGKSPNRSMCTTLPAPPGARPSMNAPARGSSRLAMACPAPRRSRRQPHPGCTSSKGRRPRAVRCPKQITGPLLSLPQTPRSAAPDAGRASMRSDHSAAYAWAASLVRMPCACSSTFSNAFPY